MKKLLAVFAHPDDEAFGPGGTLAKHAAEGAEIHILTATRGEAGQWDKNSKFKIQNSKLRNDRKIHHVREEELLKSARILGIRKVEFLDFVDGRLCNAVYHDLANKIIAKIKKFRPQVILTFDQHGISGHIDHITVTMVTTYAYLKTNIANKLYYYCLSEEQRRKEADKYFIYFPDGFKQKDITTKIDYNAYFEIKKTAMHQHQSQLSDVNKILRHLKKLPKIENFILKYHRKAKINLPETDLFSGIDA